MMVDKSNKEYLCERICRMYIETGRTIRSLATYFHMSKSDVGRYLKNYSSDLVSYDLKSQVEKRAKQNMLEVYQLGCSENRYSDQLGSME